MEKDTVILSNYGDKDDLSFKEWADQEMLTHGKKESFDDWLNDELSHHGDNMTLQDWGQHELDSHYERYGAEMANWSGRPKTPKPYRGLESKTRKRIKQESAYSQMMIGSLIGLGAGLWAFSRWKENQEGQ